LPVLEALQRLAPALLRHLLAYGDLLCEETGDALRQWRRRAMGLLVAVLAGAMALALGCVWAIAAVWDSPYRMDVIGALCISFLLIAIGAGLYVRTEPPSNQRLFGRLRTEWHEDRQMLAALDQKVLSQTEPLPLD